jgi:uncharacterized caspase-like protein
MPYQPTGLPNPPNDSDDMATVLEQVGFEVMVLKDGSLKKMKKAIQPFLSYWCHALCHCRRAFAL